MTVSYVVALVPFEMNKTRNLNNTRSVPWSLRSQKVMHYDVTGTHMTHGQINKRGQVNPLTIFFMTGLFLGSVFREVDQNDVLSNDVLWSSSREKGLTATGSRAKL
jgi:hypothetical protein